MLRKKKFLKNLKDRQRTTPDEEFDFVRKLGSGSNGEVWEVRTTKAIFDDREKDPQVFMEANVVVAIKILSSKTSAKDKGEDAVKHAINKLLKDSGTHSLVSKDPNIVEFKEIFNVYDSKSGFPKQIFILHIMELCGGDLKALIKRRKCLEMDQSLEWLVQVVSGLKYLHDNNIAHFDIKPSNILYIINPNDSKRLLFKLTDFGLEQRFSMGGLATTETESDTTLFKAPEAERKKYDAKCADIYSLGITFALSLSGYERTATTSDLKMVLLLSLNDTVIENKWGLDSHTCNLLLRITYMDPMFRYSIYDIPRHPFVLRRNTPYVSGEYSYPKF